MIVDSIHAEFTTLKGANFFRQKKEMENPHARYTSRIMRYEL
jgi:hypothetical protein